MKLNRSKFELAAQEHVREQKSLKRMVFRCGTLCTLMAGKNARPETIGRVVKSSGRRC